MNKSNSEIVLSKLDASGALTRENLPEQSKEFSAAGQLINKSETKPSDEIKQEEKSENKQEVKDNDEESKDTAKKHHHLEVQETITQATVQAAVQIIKFQMLKKEKI